ncbi:MAG: MFS transporter [Trueperaceae bacterium]|nr:MFS transporter [Trueperaceae bacterium]
MPDAPLLSRTIERSPVYYGWVVLAVGTLGLMMTTPGQTVGVSVFLDPIIADLGASRTEISLLYTIGTLAGALALPWVGRSIDRRGPRLAVGWIAAGLALACIYMATVTSLPALAFGFVLLRGLGQGSLGLVSLLVINVWFVRRRALAVGLTGLGMALATAGFPPLIEALIEAFGWRTAYALLGALVAATILPLGLAFFRGHPERFGQRPDGRTRPGTVPVVVDEPAFTAAQARRTAAFWLLAGSVAMMSALGTGLIFHHFDLMAARGIDRAAAATVFTPFALVIAATNLGAGALIDRLNARVPVVAMLVLQAACLAAATVVAGPTLPLYGVLLGVTQGTMGVVSGSLFAKVFGRAAIGGIKGTAQTLSVAGAAAGPVLLALGIPFLGGYGPALWALVPLPLLLAIGVAVGLRKPTQPDAAAA